MRSLLQAIGAIVILVLALFLKAASKVGGKMLAKSMTKVFAGKAGKAAIVASAVGVHSGDDIASRLARGFDGNSIEHSLAKEGDPNARLRSLLEIPKGSNGQVMLDSNVSIKDAAQLTLDQRAHIKQKKLASYENFVVLPTSRSEYASLFGKQASHADLKRLTKTKANFSEISHTEVVGKASVTKIVEKIALSDANYLTFVGHNVHGNLILSRTAAVPIAEVSEFCTKMHKTCIFISCDSGSYVSARNVGVGGEITYDEAVLAMKIVQSHITTIDDELKTMSVERFSRELTFEINSRLSSNRTRARVYYVSVRVGIVTTIGGVIITTDSLVTESAATGD